MLQLEIVGSHEQVGCEKPSTLSGRQRTALLVVVGGIVSVCVHKKSLHSLCGCLGIAVLGREQRSNAKIHAGQLKNL